MPRGVFRRARAAATISAAGGGYGQGSAIAPRKLACARPFNPPPLSSLLPLSAEAKLHTEMSELKQTLHAKSAELQQMAQKDAEAAYVVASAQAQMQRMAADESRASMAIGLVQQQAVLRAGRLGEQLEGLT